MYMKPEEYDRIVEQMETIALTDFYVKLHKQKLKLVKKHKKSIENPSGKLVPSPSGMVVKPSINQYKNQSNTIGEIGKINQQIEIMNFKYGMNKRLEITLTRNNYKFDKIIEQLEEYGHNDLHQYEASGLGSFDG